MLNIVFDEVNHKYYVNNIERPSVTKIMADIGLSDFSSVPKEILDKSCKFGTAVHKATELRDKGTLDYSSLSSPIVPYLKAWEKFVEDQKFEIIEIEKKFYNEKYGYCGTIDRIGYSNVLNKKIIIDLKTSSTMSAKVGIQLAGYGLGIDHIEYSRWGLQLKKDGSYKIVMYNSPTDVPIFLSALNIWKWKKANGLLKEIK